jgi:hypothetical protein
MIIYILRALIPIMDKFERVQDREEAGIAVGGRWDNTDNLVAEEELAVPEKISIPGSERSLKNQIISDMTLQILAVEILFVGGSI